MKQERKVIHVYIKDQDKHYYFGSIKAIYSNIEPRNIGLQYQSLINFFATSNSDVYENSKCVIRKDILITQKILRGSQQTE